MRSISNLNIPYQFPSMGLLAQVVALILLHGLKILTVGDIFCKQIYLNPVTVTYGR